MNTIDEFRQAIQSAGLEEPPEIIEPGKLHRFPTNGRRYDDAGWCKLFEDCQGGVFGDFRSGLSEVWQVKRDKPFTPSERKAWKGRCDAERREREVEKASRHAEAARKASEILAAATDDPAVHPYAVKKQIPFGSQVRRGLWEQRGWSDALLIPVHGPDGTLWSVEAVNADGVKDFLAGGRTGGGFHALGEVRGASRVLIFEGLANAAVGSAVDGSPAVAALSAGNLKATAVAVRELAPEADIVLIADNTPEPGGSNPGVKAAEEAAAAVNGRVAVPELDGRACDVWDLWHERGVEAVREAIVAAEAPPERDQDVFRRLAALSPVEYDRVRSAEAKRLKIKVATLDTEVRELRLKAEAEKARCKAAGGVQGEPVPLPDVEPSNEEARLRSVDTHVLSGDPPSPRARPQGDILIDIGRQVARELFLGNDDRAYAVVRDRAEVWPVDSRRFRAWLRSCYFTLVGKGANANSIRDAIDTIEASARDSGVERRVFLRVAEAGGKLYVDLCDRDWRVVEVDAEGWRILDQSPVMFTRRGGATSFPIPERGGSLDELWPLVNVPEDAWPLVGVWSVAALYPRGPYPPLAFQGEHGSAKSSVAKMARFLCDPSDNYLRSVPKDEDGFKALCAGAWCICIDNLSGVQPWLSDLLCRAASGITLGSRKLYTDLDEELIKVCRPIILNGIDPIAVRGDLADRTITLTLNPISDETRLTEEDLHERFEKLRPRLFGVLLSALSQVVRDLPNTPKPPLPRMASFAMLGIACETALGFKAGAFMRAYKANIAASAEAVLDSGVAEAIIEFIRARGEWTGTASELLKTIGPADGDRSRSAMEWPKNGRGMTGALTRFAPALRRIGIHVGHRKASDAKRTRLTRLTCNAPAQPSDPSDPSEPKVWCGSPVGRSDGSTVREPGNRPKPSEKTSNEINGSGGSDGSDGSAATPHTWSTEIVEGGV